MLHEHILAKASEYRAGTLEPAERAAVERHLKTCSGCRTVMARWRPGAPSVDFTDRVMARVPGGRSEVMTASPWVRKFQVWGTVAAAVLVAAAFWHPENGWVRSDHGFARWDASAASSAPVVNKGVRHD